MEILAEEAQAIVAAAIAKVWSLGIEVSAAVLDWGGNLRAFVRMNGAEIAGAVLAIDKAYTSVANRISTHELATLATALGGLYSG